jgi:hypothetical protein
MQHLGLSDDQMSKDQSIRKIKLCQEVIKVLNKITPGRADHRADMLFEHFSALRDMISANIKRRAEDVEISAVATAALKYLKEAMTIFNDSPKGSTQRLVAETIEQYIIENSSLGKTPQKRLKRPLKRFLCRWRRRWQQHRQRSRPRQRPHQRPRHRRQRRQQHCDGVGHGDKVKI